MVHRKVGPLHRPSTPSTSSYPTPAPDWQNKAGERHATILNSLTINTKLKWTHISYKSLTFLQSLLPFALQENCLHLFLSPQILNSLSPLGSYSQLISLPLLSLRRRSQSAEYYLISLPESSPPKSAPISQSQPSSPWKREN